MRMNLARSLILSMGWRSARKPRRDGQCVKVDLSAPKLAITPERRAGASALLHAKLAVRSAMRT